MKKVIVIILIVIIVLGGLYVTSEMLIRGLPDSEIALGEDNIIVPDDLLAEDMNIVVMSFNIRNLTKEDDSADNWANRKDNVVDVIEDNSPDLIGLQEVKVPQYNYLVEALGDEYGSYCMYRSGINQELAKKLNGDNEKTNLLVSYISEGVPIFYKKSRFEVLESDTFWLAEKTDIPNRGWDAACRRICSSLRLKDHYSNKELTYFNTHADHKGNVAKEKSVELITERISETLGGVIITGDFNLREDSTSYALLTAEDSPLVDTRYEATVLDNSSTSDGFTGDDDEKIIDYIFVEQEIYEVIDFTVKDEPYDDTHYVSDHHPIMATISFKAD